LRVVYGLYLTLFALCLAVRSRRSFRVLIVIFVFVSCISSYGIGWREGYVYGLSDKPAENSK
jgi:hypothetical protein